MTQHAHLERRLNELARELELACRLKYEHDLYRWSEGLIACRRCGMQWQAKNGD